MAAMFRATRLSRPPAASSQRPLETREEQRREPLGRGQEPPPCVAVTFPTLGCAWEQTPPVMGKHRARLQAAAAGGREGGMGKAQRALLNLGSEGGK